ncbi:MAG: hypothetical protein HY966_07925 [Ignavibacteriales bacterium]|nr:hypothetical protein [Ignavibacteriales bacterium]
MKRAGILIIHGMGNQEPNFARDFIKELRKRLGAEADELAIEPCWWADILQQSQEDIWRRLKANNEMSWNEIRHFMISNFSDPPQYLSGYFRTGQPIYREIHERVREKLAVLEEHLDDPSAPLMILAHSLGCTIISNYMWDAQRPAPDARTPFQRTETLWSLFTYGCNIPLFVPPTRPIECISIPWASAPARIKPTAHWTNVFAPSDVLGFPLATLFDDLHGTRITDTAMNAGPWPISRTPFAHTEYENDEAFLSQATLEIRQMLQLPPA